MNNTRCSWWWTIRNRRNKQPNKEEGNQIEKIREDKNSRRDEDSVKPQQRDHSKRLRWLKTFNSSNIFSLFSKERQFRSNQTVHIMHPGIKVFSKTFFLKLFMQLSSCSYHQMTFWYHTKIFAFVSSKIYSAQCWSCLYGLVLSQLLLS